MTKTSWSHVALNCGDLATTERFYTSLFGFRRANRFTVGTTEIVFLTLDGAYLELFADPMISATAPARTAADGPSGRGAVRHLAFQVDDVDAFLAFAGPAADISLGPLDFHEFIEGWRTVWLRDPDGVVVEVSQGYRDAVVG